MSKLSHPRPSAKHIPIHEEKARRCVRWLNISLGLGFIYALALVFTIALSLAMPDLKVPDFVQGVILLIWAIAKIGFAFSLVCLYQSTGYLKWAIAALLLAASAIMPYILTNPESLVFVIGIEALAVTGLSLSLFDLGRATRLDMGIPAGMIFLGVILQILQDPLMSFVGILFLAIGFYLSLKRLTRPV
ncbi:MAG TPA: hypothetical protein G4O05_06305 [Caldilineae bacterium]|nr:hypothetical protein [Caldilineae bacterium]HIQ12272.1 hypothetical protein [Caldilineales bacterium]